jgi:hypothetical protein
MKGFIIIIGDIFHHVYFLITSARFLSYFLEFNGPNHNGILCQASVQ